ncbi:hypothetical protein BTJ39_17660 [Izhakiella australiensis]|uniref:NERD domain-containing protein n=1 Tax=Izhakiella australiensis TaxID=1926881 RepID=A0A1S8YIF0_9GAMM|nr:hypothetical protein [Izhakiella australiensis]OON38682.1 hypothetical protein BTJ39_17660 [Izhakiella australiensis]
MQTYDVKRILEKAARPQAFYPFFTSYIRRDDISLAHALDVLRVSGIYLNRFSVQTLTAYNDNFRVCIDALLQVFPQQHQEIAAFEQQCRMMHDLNNAFFQSITGNNIWNKRHSQSRSLAVNFIVFCEIYLSSINAVLMRADPRRVEKAFPLFILPPNIANERHADVEKLKVISRAIDEIVFYTGKIFAFIRGADPMKLSVALEKRSLLSSVKYLNEWNQFDSLSRISDYFRLSKATITPLNDREYRLDTDNACLYKDYEVARCRLMMRAINLDNELRNAMGNNEPIVDTVPSYLTRDGLFDAVLLSQLENMAPQDLHEQYGGVSLYDWVHAYRSLVALAAAEMKSRLSARKPIPLDAHRWLIVKSRRGWIDLFCKRGLSAAAAALVTDYFTFNKQAQDLNDCPFIACEGGLCLMPALVASSSATRSLMSLFSAKKINLTRKGKFHEQQFLQMVQQAGIPARSLDAHKDFECDCLMIIDDHLVFTELKSNGNPLHYGRYYQTVCNITGDASRIPDNKNKMMRSCVDQLNRCADHYLQHPEVITAAFGLAASWRAKGVVKVIVTTTTLGGVYHVDDCYVIDKLSITSFFHRASGTVYRAATREEVAKIQQPGYQFCEGRITIDKLRGYLAALPSINFTRQHVKKLTYNVGFGDILIHYPYYDPWPAAPFIQTGELNSADDR